MDIFSFDILFKLDYLWDTLEYTGLQLTPTEMQKSDY